MSKKNNARTKRAHKREELSKAFAKNNYSTEGLIEINSEIHNILANMIEQSELFKGFEFKYIKQYFEKTDTEKRSTVAARIRHNQNVTQKEYDNLKPLLKRIEEAIEKRDALDKSGSLKNEFRLAKQMNDKEEHLENKKAKAKDPKTKFEYEQSKEKYRQIKSEYLLNKAQYIKPLIASLIFDYAEYKAENQIMYAQQRELAAENTLDK